jgi:acyl-coenzyme A synthetase/AMP-(fatty) acid ligase
MLKVGGRKVNPGEVEMALNRHPGVVESAVAGVPDPNGILENELHAFVVPHRGTTLTETELLAQCRQLVEPYKVPARIHFRASLPKSPGRQDSASHAPYQ